jgi:hypothetical protein
MMSSDYSELAELEMRVHRALTTGDESDLEVLGYGEISCVLEWRHGSGEFAAKRLPVFDSAAGFEAYRAVFSTYLDALAETGVPVAPSRLETTRAADGRIAVWCLQPLLERRAIASRWLRQATAGETERLVAQISDLVLATVTPRLGLDGQLSNWAMDGGGHLYYFDVTTPMMRDDEGREALDTELFLASLPWALRGLVRRFLLGSVLDKYYRPREVLRDLLANLIKEGISDRLALGLEIVNRKVAPALDEAEVRRYYRDDARMWAFLQRLRRIDRWWQRKMRRRQYPFLLPGKVERHV